LRLRNYRPPADDAFAGNAGRVHPAQDAPQSPAAGVQQRMAIATALANEPDILLADEPTGELDSKTARRVSARCRPPTPDSESRSWW
jgi:ABC-type lipoprotein export system ATPase subunit